MSSYGFIKELIEKEHTPTPAYVFDLEKKCRAVLERAHSYVML